MRILFLSCLLMSACTKTISTPVIPAAQQTTATFQDADTLILPQERAHITSLKQLTFGGENAEAYWSFDGKDLVFQSTREGNGCDQIYTLNIASGAIKRVSPGGSNTCAFFTPDGERIIYATTALDSLECPTKADMSKGYVWKIHKGYDIVSVKRDGSDLKKLTTTQGYDAEATISPQGKVVFTSVRDGDIELYSMNTDGSDQKRLTNSGGYDGGAFFTADGKKLVWRASRPKAGTELNEFHALMNEELVRPGRLELIIGDADGKNPVELTRNGAANFGPFPSPDGKSIIYASNQGDPKGREFDLYRVPSDGGASEQVTFAPDFDGFPMFSPDGKYLVFASNRNGKERGETNLFLATWKD